MRLLILALLTLFSSACARPDYISQEDMKNASQQKPNEECALKLLTLGSCVQIRWKEPPSSTQVSELSLQLAPEVSGDIDLYLWMPSMGHGSAPVKIESLGQGRYLVTRIYFIMPGDWEIRILVRNSQKEILDQLAIPVMIP